MVGWDRRDSEVFIVHSYLQSRALWVCSIYSPHGRGRAERLPDVIAYGNLPRPSIIIGYKPIISPDFVRRRRTHR